MATIGMTEDELVALVNGQIDDAKAYDSSVLQADRKKALDFVEGRIDLVAEEGKSSVVSRDLADVLDWVIPSLDRIFLASDKVATYGPKRPEIVQGPQGSIDISQKRAAQVTDYMNAVFLGDCDGYSVLHDGFYDSLLHGNGIIKHWWDPSKEYTTETFRGLSEESYLALMADPEVERAIEHTAYVDPAFARSTGVDVTVRQTAYNSVGGEGGGALADGINAASRGVPGYEGLAFLRSVDGTTDHRPEHVAKGAAAPDGIGSDPDAVDKVPNHDLGHAALPEAQRGLAAGSAETAPGASPAADSVAGLVGALGPLAGPVAPSLPLLHDVKVKRVVSTGRLRVDVLPGEAFRIVKSKVLDETTLGCGHEYQLTRSELIKRGYDRTKVEDAPAGATVTENDADRDDAFVVGNAGSTTKDKSTEMVDVFEWYPLVDYDGDGVAERRKVVMLGLPSKRAMVENVEWGDDLPFTDLKVHPIPHRWKGKSLFDVMYDIQRNKTVLLRQTNDNLYMTNNPMTEVVEGRVINIDVLIDREIGGNVFVTQAGSVRPLEVPFTAQHSFQMLAYWDDVQERRTGVSRSSQVPDMDQLTNQTAAAVHEKQAAGAIRPEFYARNLKEMGLKRLFRCLLKLIVKNQDRPRTIRIRDEWVEFDPRGWDADYDVSINTGLGSGSRERDLAMLNAIKAEQEKVLLHLGPNNPIVSLVEYRNTLAKMVEVAGMRDPEQFFKEVTPETIRQMMLQAQQAQQQPNPKVLEAQAKAQADQAKMQAEMQMQAAKMQAEFQMRQQEAQAEAQQKAAEAQARAQFEREKAQAELQLSREKAAAEILALRERAAAEVQLMRERAAAEIEMKQQELTFEFELKRQQMLMGAAGPAATNIQEVTQ